MEKFRRWRRSIFKRELISAYSEGLITSQVLHTLLDRFDRAHLPERLRRRKSK